MQRRILNRFSFVFVIVATAMATTMATTGPAGAGETIVAAARAGAADPLTGCSPYDLNFSNIYTSGQMVLALSRAGNGYTGEISNYSSGVGAGSANGPVTDLTVTADKITFNSAADGVFSLPRLEGCGLKGSITNHDSRVGTVWSDVAGKGKMVN